MQHVLWDTTQLPATVVCFHQVPGVPVDPKNLKFRICVEKSNTRLTEEKVLY